MLHVLKIKNLALVESLTWELGAGLQIVTGETGAGKSMIIGALQLLLGERAERRVIRHDSDRCEISALFQLDHPAPIDAALEEMGLEPCEEGELLLQRSIERDGKGRQYINGSPTTLAMLKQLGRHLVDLHGPHDHQSLFSPTTQRQLLDAYGKTTELADQFHALEKQIQTWAEQKKRWLHSDRSLEQELDYLQHQIEEIERADIDLEKLPEWETRYTQAQNARELLAEGQQLLGSLQESDDSLLERLEQGQRALAELARLDPSVNEMEARFASAQIELREIAAELEDYLESVEIDPEQVQQLEARFAQWEELKRKFGPSLEDVLCFAQRAREKRAELLGVQSELETIDDRIVEARANQAQLGAQLSQKRARAAQKMARAIEQHLRELGMPKAHFRVALRATPTPHGLEHIEFQFAPNPGGEPLPLSRIASSGEMSRAMLAMKSTLIAQDSIELLVFDEIDANIGGEIGHTVGQKMATLATQRQILCITHLPQVAAHASDHYCVSKKTAKATTVTHLEKVERHERQKEIARMLGGETESALAHAEAMLG